MAYTPLTRKRVYLVEDNGLIRQNLAQVLGELADAEICGSAASAEDAIKWLQLHRERWDVAVIDLFLTQGSGMTVLRDLNALGDDRHQSVIFSNYVTQEVVDQAMRLGAKRVFDKSTQIEELIAFIRDAAPAAA